MQLREGKQGPSPSLPKHLFQKMRRRSPPLSLSPSCHDGDRVWRPGHSKTLRGVLSSRVSGQRLGASRPGLCRAVQEGGTPGDESLRGHGPGARFPGPGSVSRLLEATGRFFLPRSPNRPSREGLSSPLKMGCDLLQSLSFGFRDAGQSEEDAGDAEGGGEPESAVGPEHLLQREGRGHAWTWRGSAVPSGPPRASPPLPIGHPWPQPLSQRGPCPFHSLLPLVP